MRSGIATARALSSAVLVRIDSRSSPATPPRTRPKKRPNRGGIGPRLAATILAAREPNRQQRFLVSLAEQAQLIKDGQPLCIEVGFCAVGCARRDGD